MIDFRELLSSLISQEITLEEFRKAVRKSMPPPPSWLTDEECEEARRKMYEPMGSPTWFGIPFELDPASEYKEELS